MSWIADRFGLSDSVLLARNALLAEHTLGQLDLDPESRLARQLASTVTALLRSKGEFVERFNSADRLTQLNMVALAFSHLDHDPLLPGEVWASAMGGSENALLRRLALDWWRSMFWRRHNVRVSVPKRRLRIVDGILTDPATASS